MNHSVSGYLRRQSTEMLELLLQAYEAQPEDNLGIAELIRNILNERENENEKPPLIRRVHIGIYTVLKKSFSPQKTHRRRNTSSISSFSEFPVRKNFAPKRKIFLRDKKKSRGKADACRGFLP